jgi:hypothetical protein
MLDTMHINVVNEEIFVSGGVEPFAITIDTIANVKTVTVVDFDGCESKVQFFISSVTEDIADGIKIFPNPATTEIHIDLAGSNNQFESLQMISMSGQALIQSQKANFINISALSEGVYILQIKLANGKAINKRVVIVR